MLMARTLIRSIAVPLLLFSAATATHAQTVNINFDDLGPSLSFARPSSERVQGLEASPRSVSGTGFAHIDLVQTGEQPW